MADILWSDIVGTAQTIEDGGYVGDLLAIARAHIDDAVIKNRLTREQAGEIYVAMIPAAFQQGIKFGMEEELTEGNTNIALWKAKTAEIEAWATKEKIEADFGVAVTMAPGEITVVNDPANIGNVERAMVVQETSTN